MSLLRAGISIQRSEGDKTVSKNSGYQLNKNLVIEVSGYVGAMELSIGRVLASTTNKLFYYFRPSNNKEEVLMVKR